MRWTICGLTTLCCLLLDTARIISAENTTTTTEGTTTKDATTNATHTTESAQKQNKKKKKKEEKKQEPYDVEKGNAWLREKEAEARKSFEQKTMMKDGTGGGGGNTTSGVVHRLPSGMMFKILRKGNGTRSPTPEDRVLCHYTGSMYTGYVFDSSRKTNEPSKPQKKKKKKNGADDEYNFMAEMLQGKNGKDAEGGKKEPMEFTVNRLIKGWNEALQYMREGDHWELYIPSALAYGEKGSGRNIPADAHLQFEIELFEVLTVGKPAALAAKKLKAALEEAKHMPPTDEKEEQKNNSAQKKEEEAAQAPSQAASENASLNPSVSVNDGTEMKKDGTTENKKQAEKKQDDNDHHQQQASTNNAQLHETVVPSSKDEL